MAKIAKVKKREVSVHSRAARRAASPPSKTSGAGKAVETEYKPWLHSAQNAGVGKKKSKQLTRQQKQRQQRGIEKADVNNGKLEKKIEDSKDRARRVQARAADWEDLNEAIASKDQKDKFKVKPQVQVSKPVIPELDSAMVELPASAADAIMPPVSDIGVKVAEVQESVASTTLAEPAVQQDIDEIT